MNGSSKGVGIVPARARAETLIVPYEVSSKFIMHVLALRAE